MAGCEARELGDVPDRVADDHPNEAWVLLGGELSVAEHLVMPKPVKCQMMTHALKR